MQNIVVAYTYIHIRSTLYAIETSWSHYTLLSTLYIYTYILRPIQLPTNITTATTIHGDDDGIVLHMEIGHDAVYEREYKSILVPCFRSVNKKLNNDIYLSTLKQYICFLIQYLSNYHPNLRLRSSLYKRLLLFIKMLLAYIQY